MNQFLSTFFFDSSGVMGLAVGEFASARFIASTDVQLPSDLDVWFTPALFRSPAPAKATKDAVLGSIALWCDIDDERSPLPILQPSIVVKSGGGWHMYWLLDEPAKDVATIERYNKFLYNDIVTADNSTWNANRWMRVPGTRNHKYDPPAEVKLMRLQPQRRYRLADVAVISQLDPNLMNRIRTGHERGFKSRSERDWAVITDLVKAGADYELCHRIFQDHAIGDKARKEESYFKHTWDAVQTKHGKSVVAKKARQEGTENGLMVLTPREDGLYRGAKRVSTFNFTPVLLLDNSADEGEDALVGDVTANGYTWNGVSFNRSAFNEVRRMDKECRAAAWQWLGNDNELRSWLPHLMEVLRGNGLPRVKARSAMGLYQDKGRWLFVGNGGTLSATDYWPNYTGVMHWLPNKRENPSLDLEPEVPSDEVRWLLRELMPQVNEPEAFWPMLGWYVATALKPWFESHSRRFPILNVTGTRGSGKTTMIQHLMLPLMGQQAPKSYDAGTTKFVSLALLGSSNAVPVAFSEFRYDSVPTFIRYILLAYDTGHDPRGRADQTVVDYPLSAPFSIDGEDLITDPAAQERIVVVQLKPAAIAERTKPNEVWGRLRKVLPKRFGGWFIQRMLAMLDSGEMERLLQEAEEDILREYPDVMPDRVRNNHIVAWMGVRVWCAIMNVAERPSPSVLKRSINNVCNLGVGRSRTQSDEFIEAVAAEVSRRTSAFKWTVEDGTTLYVQITPAHSWWLTMRRRQNRSALELPAIKNQLSEAPYWAGSKVIGGALLYGIKLDVAHELGLDVANRIDSNELTIQF